MRMPLPATLVACFVPIISLAHEPALTNEDKSRIEAEVRETVDHYIEAVKAGDMEEMSRFWGDFDDFIHAGDGRVFGDRDKWISWMRNNSADEFVSWENSNIHVAVLATNAASYTTDFETLSITGGEEFRVTGSWTYVLRKANGRWSVVHSNGRHNEFSYYD